MIPALVLAAGLGTRLRPLSLVRAKPAMPVAGEPLVRRILRRLREAGITNAVLNLHHLPHTVTGVVGDGTDLDLRVRYSWEMPVLGSAGGPRKAVGLLGSGTFLIVNGDTLADVDIPGLVADHQRSGAMVTLAVAGPDGEADPGGPATWSAKYGGVVVEADGRVAGFVPRGSLTPSLHFVGIQVAEPEAFSSVGEGEPAESVGSVYPALIAARPGSVRARISRGTFLDIGTPADYLQASLFIAAREPGAPLHGARTRIDPTSRIERSIVWDDVEVGPGARLLECIVADGARVPAGASWEGVTLRRATDILASGERRVGELAVGAI